MAQQRSHTPRDLDELLSRTCDGTATPDELKELAASIAVDERVRMLYIEYLADHAEIGNLIRREQAAEATAPVASQVNFAQTFAAPPLDDSPLPVDTALDSARSPAQTGAAGARADKADGLFARLRRYRSLLEQAIDWKQHPARFLGAAAVLTAFVWIVGAAFVLPWWEQEQIAHAPPAEVVRRSRVATLVRLVDAVWESSPIVSENTRLPANRTLKLKAGLAEIKLDDGARLILEGPAELIIDGANRCELKTGRLAARMRPGSSGLVIEAPRVTVTDLGTEFGIAAGPSDTRVAVFEGRVEAVTRNLAGEEVHRQTLTIGQSVCIADSGQNRPKESVDTAQFVRQLPPWARQQLVYADDFDRYDLGPLAGQRGWSGGGTMVTGQFDRTLTGSQDDTFSTNASLFELPATAQVVVFEAQMRLRGGFTSLVGPVSANGRPLVQFGAAHRSNNFRVRDFHGQNVVLANPAGENALSGSRHAWFDVRLTVTFNGDAPLANFQVRKVGATRYTTLADAVELNLDHDQHTPDTWTGLFVRSSTSSDQFNWLRVGYVASETPDSTPATTETVPEPQP